MTVYTFGHSTTSSADSLAFLKKHDIDTLIDIRSHPVSKWPQWNRYQLRDWVNTGGINYMWLPALGGWTEEHRPMSKFFEGFGVDVPCYCCGKFPKHRIAAHRAPETDEPEWTSQGLYDYQFVMTLPQFRYAVDDLLDLYGGKKHCAIMCCEFLWWKCHRSMVADYITHLGEPCYHLQPRVTLHQRALGNRLERYHPYVKRVWSGWRA